MRKILKKKKSCLSLTYKLGDLPNLKFLMVLLKTGAAVGQCFFYTEWWKTECE